MADVIENINLQSRINVDYDFVSSISNMLINLDSRTSSNEALKQDSIIQIELNLRSLLRLVRI